VLSLLAALGFLRFRRFCVANAKFNFFLIRDVGYVHLESGKQGTRGNLIIFGFEKTRLQFGFGAYVLLPYVFVASSRQYMAPFTIRNSFL